MKRRKKVKDKVLLTELLISTILAIFGISLFSWGYSEMNSIAPWGITSNTFLANCQKIGLWFLCVLFSLLLCTVLIQTLWNLLHKKAFHKITITSILLDSISKNRCTVTGYLDDSNIEKYYMLLTEVNNNSVIVLDLASFKLKICKIKTVLDMNDIRSMTNVAPKKLITALARANKK